MNQPCSHLCRVHAAAARIRRAGALPRGCAGGGLGAAEPEAQDVLQQHGLHPALDRVSRDLPQLATGGTLAFTFFSNTFAHIHSRSRSLTPKASCSAGEDVLCKEDMRRLAKVAKVRLGNRPFFINSQMYNVLHKMTGSKQRTGTAMVRQAQPFHVW